MRINANKKVHKRKRDPFELLARTAGVLVVALVVGIGVFYLCTLAITNDYNATRDAIAQQNEEAEVEFNAKMNALRSNQNATLDPETGEITSADLPFWEATIEERQWRIEDEGTAGLENTGTVTLERSALLTGGLLLVNAWHALPYDFSDADLVSVGTASGYKIPVQNASVRLFPAAYDALSEMLNAANEAGLEHYIVREAYRTNDEQTSLFNDEMASLSEKYSGDILIEQAKKRVNYPGTSEYQTGMSFRMDLYNKENKDGVNNLKFQESKQGEWFTENAWKYGVIFRFPVADFPNSSWEDKSYKTAVSSRMNLYRYVGPAHAAAMRIMDYCLEEYVEFLVNHPHICIYQDGALKYEIVRINMNEGDTSFALPVPNPASDYQASMDNMGGIVMAYTYN